MKELLSERTYTLLNQWADLDANKEHPAEHPNDEQRWLDFVIATYREGVDSGDVANRLAGWLMNKKGWEDVRAHEMVNRYEYAIAVLKAYNR